MKGFTLIETMIGIVVLGIIALGLFATFTGVFTNAARDEVVTIATGLAKGELERTARLSFSSIVSQNAGTPMSFGGNFTNYSWQIVVSAVPVAIASDAGMAQYKQVESRVTNPLVGDISLKTIVTNN
ncbi:MAG: type II secretion system protein [Candidatus Omnitrophota bacterium]|nr:type II secretion system protein [Candidatus Omnitrophota bacterium]